MRRQFSDSTEVSSSPLEPLVDVLFAVTIAIGMSVTQAEMVEVPFVPPVPGPTVKPANVNTPVVLLAQNEALSINGRPTNRSALVADVRKVLTVQRGRKPTVLLRGHRDCRYDAIFSVRDALQRAGFDVIEVGQVTPDSAKP